MKLFIIKRLGARDYKIFLPLLWFVVALLLFLALFGLYGNNWSLAPHYYSYCSDTRGCFNNYYNSSICKNGLEYDSICTQIRMDYNESIGIRPSWIVSNSSVLVVIVVVLWLFLNTILFNRELLRGKI